MTFVFRKSGISLPIIAWPKLGVKKKIAFRSRFFFGAFHPCGSANVQVRAKNLSSSRKMRCWQPHRQRIIFKMSNTFPLHLEDFTPHHVGSLPHLSLKYQNPGAPADHAPGNAGERPTKPPRGVEYQAHLERTTSSLPQGPLRRSRAVVLSSSLRHTHT